jgi:hypothetical protein
MLLSDDLCRLVSMMIAMTIFWALIPGGKKNDDPTKESLKKEKGSKVDDVPDFSDKREAV